MLGLDPGLVLLGGPRRKSGCCSSQVSFLLRIRRSSSARLKAPVAIPEEGVALVDWASQGAMFLIISESALPTK